MEVYKWPEEATGEGVAVYATNGASVTKSASSGGRRVEFFVGFSPEFDDIAPSMSLLGSYPQHGGDVWPEETVTLGEPLWPGAAVSTFLVIPQIEELLPPLVLPDSSHVHFCQVLPISESELQLKRLNGAVWLLGELNDKGIPTWRSGRRYL
ncbi:suppressor of fused domain protein [Micromonospora sp. NPDC004551]|uniref:suppressor of fused domain protein n=1 Tax=Micromonospora sp. NPDC004551 TaxID=3154284 RepID=UPI0033A16703